MQVNLFYFVLAKIIYCYFPTANLIGSNVRTKLVTNNMLYLVLDNPIVLAYLIHEMNESIHKQSGHVASLDLAPDHKKH